MLIPGGIFPARDKSTSEAFSFVMLADPDAIVADSRVRLFKYASKTLIVKICFFLQVLNVFAVGHGMKSRSSSVLFFTIV